MATAKVWDAATSSWVEVLDTIQAIPQAIGTAAGSLVGFSASGTPVEIPAAAGDGYTLTSDTSQPGGVGWAPRFHVVQEAGTTSYFPTTYGNIVNITAFTAVSGRRYLLSVDGWAQDGASGATRICVYRFFDGSSAIGAEFQTTTINTGTDGLSGRAVYTAPSSGSKSLYLQAKCASGSPAVRLAAAVITVQEID